MATDATTSALNRSAEVFYPERDGRPMAETAIHQEVMIDLIIGLRDWFAADPLIYVAGNQFLYFVEGDPKRNVSPDVMVIRGVDKTLRPNYKTWEEGGKGPDLVVEVSSKSTRRDDLRKKFALYRDDLQVQEYILFDPLGEYLKPRLQGFRLAGDDYFAIDPEDGRLPSEVLGLHLVASGQTVRLFDPTVGRIVPNRLEAIAAATESSRRQSRTLREQAATLTEREMTIREREMAIRERDLTIGQQDLALRRAELERAELLAEIARLQSRERSD